MEALLVEVKEIKKSVCMTSAKSAACYYDQNNKDLLGL